MRASRIALAASALALVAIMALAAFFLMRSPSNDRAWQEHLSVLARPSVSADRSRVAFESIRNFAYDESGVVSRGYLSRDYEVAAVSGVRFILEPFPELPAFGHTFLVFEFDNAEPVAFSIESRLEEGERYSVGTGLLNSYELAYTWGTERDFLTRRAVMLGNELYGYPLALSREDAQDVFIALAEATAELEAAPRFYNTLAHNCTNELANIVNERTEHRLPWGWSRVLTGFSDAYLFRMRLIEGASFADAREAARMTDAVKALAAEPDFSRALRDAIAR